MILLFLVALLGASEGTDLIAQSKHFSFHNNPWVNEHHFLFHVAKRNKQRVVTLNELTLPHIPARNTDFGTAGGPSAVSQAEARLVERLAAIAHENPRLFGPLEHDGDG